MSPHTQDTETSPTNPTHSALCWAGPRTISGSDAPWTRADQCRLSVTSEETRRSLGGNIDSRADPCLTLPSLCGLCRTATGRLVWNPGTLALQDTMGLIEQKPACNVNTQSRFTRLGRLLNTGETFAIQSDLSLLIGCLFNHIGGWRGGRSVCRNPFNR